GSCRSYNPLGRILTYRLPLKSRTSLLDFTRKIEFPAEKYLTRKECHARVTGTPKHDAARKFTRPFRDRAAVMFSAIGLVFRFAILSRPRLQGSVLYFNNHRLQAEITGDLHSGSQGKRQ